MIEEELLQAWIKLSTTIKGNRVLEDLSLNEMIIFNILLENEKKSKDFSFSDLLKQTKMLKSQLNHVLNKMQEEHYLISYAKDDKRKIYYRINQDGLANYELEHQKIIKILSKSISQMGEEKTKQLVDLLNQYVDLFSKIMKEE
jgi:hypothetical protein